MDKLFAKEPLEEFFSLSQEIISNLYKTQCDLIIDDQSVVEQAKEEFKDIIFKCNFDMHKIKETFHNNSWNQDKINCFTSLLEEKQSELLYSVLNYYNSSYGETVNNFDWILKLVLGTNELKSLKYPLLQLILSTSNNRGEQINTTYELTKDIVLKMIHALEEISEQ